MVSHAGASETGGSEGKLHKLVPPDLVRSKITVLQICMHRGLVVQTMYQIHILQGLLDFLIPLKYLAEVATKLDEKIRQNSHCVSL